MKRCLSLLLLFFLLTGCTSAPETSSEGPDEPAVPAGPSISTTEPSTSPEEVPDPRRETIDRLLSSMTLEEKVGQIFFARCPQEDGAALASQYHLGGYILFGRDFKDKTAEQVKEDIASYQSAVEIPMLIGVD